jgi:phospholipase D1/2
MTNPLQQPMQERTVHQIVDKDGNPYAATITSNLWVSDPGRFANPTEGNQVQAFVTGKAYFADLIKEIAAAKSQILIAGWQVNWDALLAPGVRLYDALYRAAEKNPALKIYVMPWDDREPVQTYDDQTAAALQVINSRLGRKQVFIRLSPSYCTSNAEYYSHHQKQVVIDSRIAYVGGMDLAYGRYCDEHFTLRADADGRQGLNRYNPCVAQVGDMPRPLCTDPDLLTGTQDQRAAQADLDPVSGAAPRIPSNAETTAQNIHEGAWQVKYKQGDVIAAINSSRLASNQVDSTTLDPARQPRMPWQDVHCRIEGPAVGDLMRNFVDRWNLRVPEIQRLAPPPAPSSFKKMGEAHIQVLRSAPCNQCQKEYDTRRYKAEAPLPIGTQSDIYTAMLKLIDKSRRFIYIENQFFVSAFGKENRPPTLTPAALFISEYKNLNQNWVAARSADISSGAQWRSPSRDSWWVREHSDIVRPPSNSILGALLSRIKRSALSGSPFHVYITLPVHPEGCLCEASIAVQVYWTMQTISFGSYSLLNGIRRIIKARELLKAKDSDFQRVFGENNKEYETIELEACSEFVTLLNLRNWAKLGERYVTEQIYVHSKTMIVDDMYALVGSANINDRSLLGERDSELAVLVMDGEAVRADIHGTGNERDVRKFSHQLRVNIWKKLLDTAEDKKSSQNLMQAILKPGHPESWKTIQKQARLNTEIYENLFNWIPRNTSRNADETLDDGHILPTWDSTLKSPKPSAWKAGNLSSPLPFQNEFWSNTAHNSPKTKNTNQIKGFITELPVFWTRGENNRFEFPSALVADADAAATDAFSDGNSKIRQS